LSTSYFKDAEKLGDSSNFAAWNIRMEVTLDENDVLEYVEVKVFEPLENALATSKAKYKKGEIKAKKIIIDSLKYYFLTYIRKLKNSKDIYDKVVDMYEFNNWNHILSLKNQIKDIKMNKGEIVQSYFMRLSQLKDQLLTVGEYMFDIELVLITLQCLPPIWETYITTIRNNDKFHNLMSSLESALKKRPR